MRPEPERHKVVSDDGDEDRYYVHPMSGMLLPGVTSILGRLPKGERFKSWERSRITKRVISNARDLPDMLRANGARNVEKWLADAPDDARDAAAARGTAVHNALEAVLVGDEVPDMSDKSVASYWRSAQKFLDTVQPEVLHFGDGMPLIETAMYGEFYAGSADAWLKIDGEVLLCDWKTSSGVRSQYALQLAAYLHAGEMSVLGRSGDGWKWEHQQPLPSFDGAAIVRISPYGWELHRVTDVQASYDAFCDAYRIWASTVEQSKLFRMEAFGE